MAKGGEAAGAELGIVAMAVGAAPTGEIHQAAMFEQEHGVGNGFDLGAVYDNSGEFALRPRPVGGRVGEHLIGLLADEYDFNAGHHNVFTISGKHAFSVGDDHAVNIGDEYDAMDDDQLGKQTKGMKSPLAVAGIIATSAAVTGLAAGTASPAAGFAFFSLLLAGLSLVVDHVRRA